ncbi:hypothetical protein EDC04DRAFT_2714034 [Pisolithus marmoratus]|nr:hypothetical protein EDC04DRAFT_2714034 [Pisolithus marmoratus]
MLRCNSSRCWEGSRSGSTADAQELDLKFIVGLKVWTRRWQQQVVYRVLADMFPTYTPSTGIATISLPSTVPTFLHVAFGLDDARTSGLYSHIRVVIPGTCGGRMATGSRMYRLTGACMDCLTCSRSEEEDGADAPPACTACGCKLRIWETPCHQRSLTVDR